MPRIASRIQRELRQTRPFPTAAAEALVALLRTADVVRGFLAHRIEPHGVTLQHYNVLRILRGAGASGLPTLEIAQRMIENTPGVTRLLDRIEAKGLARRERCRHDRRQILCRITPAGLACLAALDAPVTTAGRQAMGGLTPRRVAQLVRLLDDLRAGLPEASEGAPHPARRPAAARLPLTPSRGDRK